MDCGTDDQSLDGAVIYPNMTKRAKQLKALTNMFRQVVGSFPSHRDQWIAPIRLIQQTRTMLDETLRSNPYELTHTHPCVKWICDVLDMLDPKIRALHELGASVRAHADAIDVRSFEESVSGLAVYAEITLHAPMVQ